MILIPLLVLTLSIEKAGEKELKAMVPDEGSVPGFTRNRPATEAAPFSRGKTGEPVPDKVVLDQPFSPSEASPTGRGSSISRKLYSNDGRLVLDVVVAVYDSAETARIGFLNEKNGPALAPTDGGVGRAAGDEAFHRITPKKESATLMIRKGNVTIFVACRNTLQSGRENPRTVPLHLLDQVAEFVLTRIQP